MHIAVSFSRYLLVLAILILAACQKDNSMSNEIMTDRSMLERFITLPFTPGSQRFSVLPVGENDSVLFVEFAFSDRTELENAIDRITGAEAGILADALLPVPDWFDPANLPPGSVPREKGYLLPGAELLPGDAFFSSPYLDGFAFSAGNEPKLVVTLFTR